MHRFDKGIRKNMIKRIIGLAAALLLTLGSAVPVRAAAEGEQTLPPVTGVENPAGALTCIEGQTPAQSEYPAGISVTYRSALEMDLKKEISVQWDTGAVNFNKAGSYAVEGIFTKETLEENGLSNPAGMKASLTVLVQKKENISTLAAAGIGIEADGRTTVRLRMPVLPWEVKALYVYSSTDGKYWKRMYADRTNGQTTAGGNLDFVKSSIAAPPYQYVVCHYMTDYRPVMFRVEVRGSALEGTSNTVRFEEPAETAQGEPLDKWNTAIDSEYEEPSHHKSGSFNGTLGQKNPPEGPAAPAGGSHPSAASGVSSGGGSTPARRGSGTRNTEEEIVSAQTPDAKFSGSGKTDASHAAIEEETLTGTEASAETVILPEETEILPGEDTPVLPETEKTRVPAAAGAAVILLAGVCILLFLWHRKKGKS